MAELILVRHGQANSHATDEASYDKLSDLGHTQARWLGEHMRATNPHFDHVITGTLRRQKETAVGMGYDKLASMGALMNYNTSQWQQLLKLNTELSLQLTRLSSPPICPR